MRITETVLLFEPGKKCVNFAASSLSLIGLGWFASSAGGAVYLRNLNSKKCIFDIFQIEAFLKGRPFNRGLSVGGLS